MDSACSSAASGEEGIEQARDEHPDLILLDLILPDTDGPDLVARLKADPATSDIPIWVTTRGDLDDAERARINGKVHGIVVRGGNGFDALQGWLDRIGVGAAGQRPERGRGRARSWPSRTRPATRPCCGRSSCRRATTSRSPRRWRRRARRCRTERRRSCCSIVTCPTGTVWTWRASCRRRRRRPRSRSCWSARACCRPT